MIRGLVGTVLGFAAGYSLMRAIEARSQGVPMRLAFQLDPGVLMTPISRLRELQVTPAGRRTLAIAPPLDADAQLTPEWAR